MFNSTVLDIVIGLVFAWFLLSLGVSAVNELFGWVTRMRAKHLWTVIGRFADPARIELPVRLRDLFWKLPVGIGDPRPTNPPGPGTPPSPVREKVAVKETATPPAVQDLYEILKAQGLDPATAAWRTRISNIEPEQFARAMVADLHEAVRRRRLAELAAELGVDAVDDDSLERFVAASTVTAEQAAEVRRRRAEAVAPPPTAGELAAAAAVRWPAVGTALAGVSTAASATVADVTGDLARWFASEMASLTRFYRRQNRKIAAVIAAVLCVVVADPDSFRILDRLRQDQALREAIALDAGLVVSSAPGAAAPLPCPYEPLGGDGDSAVEVGSGAPPPDPIEAIVRQSNCIANYLARAHAGPIPELTLVWQADHSGGLDWIGRWLWHGLPGRIVTAVALLFGSSFWYDALRRLVGMKQRLAGSP